MAIIDNGCTEIGDILLMKPDIPILGLVSLSSFTDTLTNETATRYFIKEFKYSLDGLNYSLWIPLTNPNLTSILLQPNDYFYIEYKYTRAGIDNTGILIFEDITLVGVFVDFSCGEVFENSIFAKFINCPDTEVLNWCINVTDKLYKQGIIPNYIIRRVNQNSSQDKDYIDFWRTIACFFAMIVIYGRKVLERFTSYPELLEEYLKQRNIYLCPLPDYQDLLYIMNNYYNEIRQRGTNEIYKEKSTTQLNLTSIFHTKSINNKQVDGELLRLIYYKAIDEFIFNLIKKEYIGWNINNSSPLFKGLTIQNGPNKAYDNSDNVQTLTKYPIYNQNYLKIEQDEYHRIIEIAYVPIGGQAGISPDISNFTNNNFDKAIKVNENLDYEITFWLKQPTFDDSDSDSESDSEIYSHISNITFGCIGVDKNNNKIDFLDVTTNLPLNTFFIDQKLNQTDKYYFIRGIIYNKNKPHISLANSILNIGFGNCLKFSPNISKIFPQIIVTGKIDVNSALYIKDLKVRPLSTPFSTGFIQPKNFIEIWMNQNNPNYTTIEIEEIMRKYLLPYNCTFKNIYILNNLEDSSSQSL